MEALIKKWWFWFIIFIIVITMVGLFNEYSQGETKNSSSTNSTINDNPYKNTTQYDGTYQFLLKSSNDNGNIFKGTGIILFVDGICKVKYEISNVNLKSNTIECDGFCGLNENDNNEFYFTLNNNSNFELTTYKCKLEGYDLTCELKSKYDLCGCSNKELKLTYLNNSQDTDKNFSQVLQMEKNKELEEEKQKKQEEERTFKAECIQHTYEELARNPDKIKGQKVKLTGKVIQVVQGTVSTNMRINITKSNYGIYTDTIYGAYVPSADEDRILEDDIITIWGIARGEYSYKSTMGIPVTLPLININYVEINK